MKTIAFVLLAGLLGTGCIPGGVGTGASFPDSSDSSTPISSPNTGPQMVIPATGGAPVMATPLGAGLYMPISSGVPIVGTAT
jgi:hypothetical protein